MIQTLILKMLFVLFSLLFILESSAEEAKVYQQDEVGNIQYNKSSAVIQNDGRIIETDSVGNKQYHKQQYIVKGSKIYQTDSVGNIQYHKPQAVIK